MSTTTRMPLTANQRTAFFEAPDQMGIPHATVAQLHEEGTDGVEDLTDFDKDAIEQIASDLRRPAGRAPDPNPGVAAGATTLCRLSHLAQSPNSDWFMLRILFDIMKQLVEQLLL